MKRKILVPYDIECHVYKRQYSSGIYRTKFVVAYSDLPTLNKCFLSSVNIDTADVILCENPKREPLPKLLNRIIAEANTADSSWFVFCHPDFILKENLPGKLATLDTSTVYGVIGARTAQEAFFGRVIQIDGSTMGMALKEPTPVQTLDEMCLIVHSSLLREGLRFDERFCVHFYGADVCMQACVMGFDVYAVQVECQHKSKPLGGDARSDTFKSDFELFRAKWNKHLPVRTTTAEFS